MSLSEIFQEMLQHSGLLALRDLLPAWLALDLRQLIFVLATPVFVGVTVWEYRRIRHDPALFNISEAVRNFMLGLGYQLTELLFAGLLMFPVYAFVFHHRLFDLELNLWTALLVFVGTDFCYYWMHRCNHRVRWYWAAHVVHHSSERMNYSTAMRQSALNIFNGQWLFYVPLIWLGLNPVWVGVGYALSLVYQFFIHTTLVGRLHPVIEFVFNTPSHHRVHHGRNPGYIDTNYGGVLILFDRLFGTFADEREKETIHYGVTQPPPRQDLLTLWTHEYQAMFRDMTPRGSLWQRLQHLWRPPEWQRTHPRQAEHQHGKGCDKGSSDSAAH